MAGLSDLAGMIGRGVQGVATLGISELGRNQQQQQGNGMLQYLSAKTPEERAMAAQSLIASGASMKDVVNLTEAAAPRPMGAPNVQFNPITGERMVSQYDPNSGILTINGVPQGGQQGVQQAGQPSLSNLGGAQQQSNPVDAMTPRARAEYDSAKAKNQADLEKVKSEDDAQLRQFRAVSNEALSRLSAIPEEKFGAIGGRWSKFTGDQSKQVLNSKLQDMVGKVRVLSKYPATGFSDSDAARLEAIVGGQVDIGKDALRDIITDMQVRFDSFDKSQAGGGAPQAGGGDAGFEATYNAMPSGTVFTAPDGTKRRKP